MYVCIFYVCLYYLSRRVLCKLFAFLKFSDLHDCQCIVLKFLKRVWLCRNHVNVQAEVREGYKKSNKIKLQTHWLKLLGAPPEEQRQHQVTSYTLLQVRYAFNHLYFWSNSLLEYEEHSKYWFLRPALLLPANSWYILKKMHNGNAKWTGAGRNKELLLCHVGSLAMLFVLRWDMYHKRRPNFSTRQSW